MLKRARMAFEIALVAGGLGFSGILHVTAGVAQIVCFVFISVAVLSLLFSLFEAAEPRTDVRRQAEPVSVAPNQTLVLPSVLPPPTVGALSR